MCTTHTRNRPMRRMPRPSSQEEMGHVDVRAPPVSSKWPHAPTHVPTLRPISCMALHVRASHAPMRRTWAPSARAMRSPLLWPQCVSHDQGAKTAAMVLASHCFHNPAMRGSMGSGSPNPSEGWRQRGRSSCTSALIGVPITGQHRRHGKRLHPRAPKRSPIGCTRCSWRTGTWSLVHLSSATSRAGRETAGDCPL